MKTRLWFFGLAALLSAVALVVAADTGLIVGGLTTVNNTTNSGPARAFGSFVLFPYITLTVTNAGLSHTNALTLRGQFSIDGSNWTTVTSWNPAVTNATNASWSPALTPKTAYWRVQVETTNSVDLSLIGQY